MVIRDLPRNRFSQQVWRAGREVHMPASSSAENRDPVMPVARVQLNLRNKRDVGQGAPGQSIQDPLCAFRSFRIDRKKDKTERKILDSQERAFWDVHRPVVRQLSPLL